MGPRVRVWSREIGESLQRSEVVEAFEAGSIVIRDEALEEGVAVLMGSEQPARAPALGLAADGVDDATVEAFDEAVGLRPIGPGEAVLDAAFCAKPIERMAAGWPVLWLVFHIDGEAVGELGAIVGEDGVNGMREVGEEALQEAGRGIRIPLGVDLQIDIACRAIDGDEGVAFVPLEGWQVLEVNMDKSDGGLLEDADSRLVRFRSLAQAVALEAAMDGAARELVIDAAPHHFDDVVERQLQPGSQFTDQTLFHGREAGLQRLGPVRMVVYRAAATPAADRGLADAEFGGQFRHRPLAALDVGSDLRSRGGVGVQIQFHDARRSLTKQTPLSTPIPSTQSPETKHVRGGDG